MKTIPFFAGLGLVLMTASCDMMMEGTDIYPGYNVSAGLFPASPPIAGPVYNIPGTYLPAIPVGPVVSAPHPPGMSPTPGIGPIWPAGRPSRPSYPVTLPDEKPVDPVVRPSIPDNGQRPGASVTRPTEKPSVPATTRPAQGRH